MDTVSFDKELAEVTLRLYPQYAAIGIYKAAALLIRDCLKQEPTVPKKMGGLRRAQRVDKAEIGKDEIAVTAGFDIEYAAKVHEMPETTNWTLVGSGPKFLSRKLAENPDKYIQFAAEYCKKKADANDRSGTE